MATAGDDVRRRHGDVMTILGEILDRMVAIPIPTWLLFLPMKMKNMPSIVPGGHHPHIGIKYAEKIHHDLKT